VAQRAGDAHACQPVDAAHCLDRALQTDDGVELEQRNRGRRAPERNGEVQDAGDHGRRQCFGIDLQAHRKRGHRVDRGADDLVHPQGVGPVNLVAEGVETKGLSALCDQCSLIFRRIVRVVRAAARADHRDDHTDAARTCGFDRHVHVDLLEVGAFIVNAPHRVVC
jgi:hypothetical protein